MTWTKLSDDFSDDCWQLSDAAWRLHVEGLIWSNRKLLDLVLPKGEVQRWAKNPDAATELVDCGWWKDEGGNYRIVHHGRYQRDRTAVVKQQEANRKNGRRGGRRPGPVREQAVDIQQEQETDSLSDSLSERDGTGQDGPGQEEVTGNVAQLALAVGADWPRWQGEGPDPFVEHN